MSPCLNRQFYKLLKLFRARSLADMHAPPYGLYDNKTVLPIIGVQGVDIITNSENNITFTIGDTIKRLLNLVIDDNNVKNSIQSQVLSII